jgi:hypothetical protein
LFYGDSTTDAGRDYTNSTNTGLRRAHVNMCASHLLCDWPDELTTTHKGIRAIASTISKNDGKRCAAYFLS